ncbi:MAG: hypothetical protein KJ579_07910 [Verrucomicrobia bacterium]|nr:hypothetical protein [Verrucomicrobiota bacterium]
MPNRILREAILTSERVDRLSEGAEIFLRRLMSVLDDFGRFDARPRVLRVACYPLRVDRVNEEMIDGWLRECESAHLLRFYAKNGRPETKWISAADLPETGNAEGLKAFLELTDFRQQCRAKQSKWPDPPDFAQPSASICCASAQKVLRTCTANAAQMRSEAEASSRGGVASGGSEATKARGAGATVEQKSAGPPGVEPRRSEGARFQGSADPSPDRLDADYNRVIVPKIESYEDIARVADPIVLAMAVSGDSEPQSWRGWVHLLASVRKTMGRPRADGQWRFVCQSFWAETHQGEKTRKPGAALTARLKEALS